MNKKGISPLIGTVLLVAIVIAMILLIMPWVTNMIEKQKAKTAEASRQFDCVTALSFELSTDSDGSIVVDNKADVAINSLNFRLFDSNGAVETQAFPATAQTTPIVEEFGRVDTGIACPVGGSAEAIATITSEGKPLTCGNTPKTVYC